MKKLKGVFSAPLAGKQPVNERGGGGCGRPKRKAFAVAWEQNTKLIREKERN